MEFLLPRFSAPDHRHVKNAAEGDRLLRPCQLLVSNSRATKNCSELIVFKAL